jgi:Ras-related protein Rab-1A
MSDSHKSNKDYDYIFKIVLIGDTSVGKSCLLTRFADDQFSESYVTTIGVDFRFKTMIVCDKITKVQVWDTAGQERYRSITNAYYRGAEAIMIVFDVTNKDSFTHIQDWMEEIIKYTGKDVVIIVGANKSDLNDRNVKKEEMEEFSKKKGIKIFECSAKTGDGVENAFKYMVETLIKKNDKTSKEKNNGNNSKLKTNEEKNKNITKKKFFSSY